MRINNHIIYIFITMLLASIIYVISLDYLWLAVLTASLFFCISLKWIKMKFTLILLGFMMLTIYNLYAYFDYFPFNSTLVRIIDVKENYYLGEVNKRKVFLFSTKDKLVEGAVYKISGEYSENRNIFNGAIGSYVVKESTLYKEDLITKIYGQRTRIYEKIKERIGSRKAALVSSVAFGYVRYLDYEDRADMSQLGLLHAVSVSGLHMVLIYSILKKMFKEKMAISISFIYVIFTGAALSTIRAFIMLLFMALSIPCERSYNKFASLSLAGIIILLLNPYAVFTAGFQLSFTATLGILTYNKIINKKLFKLPKFLRESVSLSVSSQIYSLPILINTFNMITLNSLLGNLFLALIINLIVIVGNLLVLVYSIDYLFNYLCYLTYNIIRFMDKVIELILSISIDNIYIPKEVAIIYTTVIVALYFYKKSHKYAIYLPIFTMLMVMVSLYSINPKLEYLKEGALLIRYRGEKEIIVLKTNVDIKLLKDKYYVNTVKRDVEKFVIGNKYVFYKEDGNYSVQIGDNNYLIKVNYKKTYKDYDIINLNSGISNEAIILNDKIVKIN